MKNLPSIILSLLLGFSISTGLSFANGLMPCEIYGLCKPDLVQKNEELLDDVDRLQGEIDELNKQKERDINTLKQQLEKQKVLNGKISGGVLKISEINSKGVSNETKLREISKAISEIGNALVASAK